jgi:hypothetical protein
MARSSEKASSQYDRGVGRPRSKTTKPGELANVAFKLDGGLVAQIDALADRLSAERPGLAITRTDVVRMAIHEFLTAHATRRKG